MCRSLVCVNAWEFIAWLICVALPSMGLMLACVVMLDVMADHYFGVSFFTSGIDVPERSTIVE